MAKIIELKGKDIINAYDGYKLSNNFGYSCANIHVSYRGDNNLKSFKNIKMIKSHSMQGNDIKMFDIFVDNPNNISCFVYINDNNEIEGRKMFFKGKQLIDHELFDIITKKDEEIFYSYGYYGNSGIKFENQIDKKISMIYNNKTIYTDSGFIYNNKHYYKKEYWIMQIDKMNYDVYPPIDYLYQAPKLKCFSNFNPSKKIRSWLEETYNVNDIKFGRSYRYKEDEDDFLKHWNQKL